MQTGYEKILTHTKSLYCDVEQLTFFRYNSNFSTFGFEHQIVLLMTFLLSVFAIFLANRCTLKQKIIINRVIAVLLFIAAFGYVIIRLILGDFDATTDLPLDICNIVAFLMPFLMWNPTRKIHDILYFWILAGTLQAVITPHLYNGFPNFTFIKYWIVHSGLIIYAIFITVAFGFYPTWKSLIKAFIAIQIYMVVLFLINSLLGSNYFYIMHKPPTASLLDYLGPWPWYILVCEGLVLFLFLLVYLPSVPFRKKSGVS